MLSAFPSRLRKPALSSAVVHTTTPSDASHATGVPAQLSRIAQASVTLAALGPRLASFAAQMETQAKTQATRAGTIAAAMDAVAQDLEKAVTELRSSSGQLQDTLKAVERIADHTRLLSINASIEAARAGEQGRAFAVVVDEVKRLADSSGQSTRQIEERMQEISESVTRVAAVTRADSPATTNDGARTVVAVNGEVRGMADSARLQLESAASVHSMGDQINTLTESLLLAVGKFRFEAHGRAQAAVEALMPAVIATIDQRVQLERAIEPWLRAHSYFELAYVTDARGRQIINNLGCRDGHIHHDETGLGKDWSGRPWFREALQHDSVCSTDVYRSTATGDFCFTIAVALRDDRGNLVGVLGSDVNFLRLVSA